MKYLGTNLCDKCWLKLAEAPAEDEAIILNTLGLERRDGHVRSKAPQETESPGV